MFKEPNKRNNSGNPDNFNNNQKVMKRVGVLAKALQEKDKIGEKQLGLGALYGSQG